MAGYSRFGFICYHYIVSNLAADFVVTICMVHNGEKKLVKTGDTISVSKGAKHLIHAQTDMNIIEIQIGESISVKDKHIFLETF